MKKLIIASTIACLMSTSAMANVDMGVNIGDSMYFRVGGNLSFAKAIDSTKRDTYGISTDKLGEMVLNPTAAVGASIMENVRAEVSLTYFPDSKVYKDVQRNSTQSLIGNTGGTRADSNFSLENKGFVVLATSYVQVAEMGPTKLYALGGAGFSMVESKLTDTFNNGEAAKPSLTFKDDLHFAYTVGFGASMEFAPQTHLDAEYSWRDIGKPDSVDNVTWPFENRASHNLSVSLRFNM